MLSHEEHHEGHKVERSVSFKIKKESRRGGWGRRVCPPRPGRRSLHLTAPHLPFLSLSVSLSTRTQYTNIRSKGFPWGECALFDKKCKAAKKAAGVEE